MNKQYLTPQLTVISSGKIALLDPSYPNRPNTSSTEDNVASETTSPNINEAITSDQEGSTGNGGFVDPSQGWGYGLQ